VKYSKFGVPILSDLQIEGIAYSLLSRFDLTVTQCPGKTLIPLLLEYLKDNLGLRITFTSLGARGCHKILGKTIFLKGLICIDESLVYVNETLFHFTAAHEIGHWLLHSAKRIENEDSNGAIEETDDCETDFWGRKILRSPKDWIEHHANVFAGSLLMPRPTFEQAVKIVQRQIGIARDIGTIFLDSQQSSERDLDEILSRLGDIFGTSRQSVLIRLKSLGILVEDNSRRLLHISEIFAGMS
jgi:Zn-dependent peptidase ImmA (M78 family)